MHCQRIHKKICCFKSYIENIVGDGWWRVPGFFLWYKALMGTHSEWMTPGRSVCWKKLRMKNVIFILSISDSWYQRIKCRGRKTALLSETVSVRAGGESLTTSLCGDGNSSTDTSVLRSHPMLISIPSLCDIIETDIVFIRENCMDNHCFWKRNGTWMGTETTIKWLKVKTHI